MLHCGKVKELSRMCTVSLHRNTFQSTRPFFFPLYLKGNRRQTLPDWSHLKDRLKSPVSSDMLAVVELKTRAGIIIAYSLICSDS